MNMNTYILMYTHRESITRLDAAAIAATEHGIY